MEILRERDKQLENAFNQIHSFELLNQEAQHENIEEELEMPEQLMTDDEFLNATRAMNVGQKDALIFITRSISEQLNNQSDERLRLFITGNAGTGKTFLFKLLINQVNQCYGKQVVKVFALTGVTERLVGGSTLHSYTKIASTKGW